MSSDYPYKNKVTSSSTFAFNISTDIYSNRVYRIWRETLRKSLAGVSISVMTIGFSDDIDLTEGCSQVSVAQASRFGTWRRKERLPLKREGFARVYCEVGPYRLRELAFI